MKYRASVIVSEVGTLMGVLWTITALSPPRITYLSCIFRVNDEDLFSLVAIQREDHWQCVVCV